jgi:6-phosphogluconolactonase (cycloisomerase 2 family)
MLFKNSIRLDGGKEIVVTRDLNQMYVLTSNYIKLLNRNHSTGALTYIDEYNVPLDITVAGRAECFVMSPDDHHLYVTWGYDSLSWFVRNDTTGALTFGGKMKDNVDGVEGLYDAKSVTVSPDGKHVYVATHGDHSVAWFVRNDNTGALTFGGKMKDNVDGVDGLLRADTVQVSPDGEHVYVIGYSDRSVAWFGRNDTTGALTYGGVMKDDVDGVDGLATPNSMTISRMGSMCT